MVKMCIKKGTHKGAPNKENQPNNTIKYTVESILKASDEPMTSQKILLELRSRGFEISDRALRRIRQELVEAGVPICSSRNMGYYIAKNYKEIKICTDDYRSKSASLEDDANKLEKIDLKEYWNDI